MPSGRAEKSSPVAPGLPPAADTAAPQDTAPAAPPAAAPPAPPATPAPDAAAVEKSYLVQRFARIGFGQFHVVGYSVAGEETVVQIPELNVCFDIGRSPYFALTSDIVCITHAHMDHIAG